MKKEVILPLLVVLFAILASSCDFPTDPPLKPGEVPPVIVNEIDSARSLLPLHLENSWTYVTVPTGGQAQSPLLTQISKNMLGGRVYWELNYMHRVAGFPPTFESAFPPYLQSDSSGLSFFSKGRGPDSLGKPPLEFVLPYPAPVGKTWEQGHVSVLVAAKDTAIKMYGVDTTFKTYRYDVRESGERVLTFYIIPGTAILRLDTPNFTYYTVSWRLQ